MKPARFIGFALKLLTHRFTGVDLILTRECNLACRYCGVIQGETKDTLSPDEWKRIIAYFRRRNHVHFIFTGGEALLYPGLAELVADTAGHSLTCLMSNGKILTAEALAELPDLDFLTLSIDPQSENGGSGKHGFGRLGMLREHADRTGLSVSVMATLTKHNIDDIPDLLRDIGEYRFPLLLSLYHRGDRNFDFRTDLEDLDFTTPEDIATLDRLAEILIEMRRDGYLIGETDLYLRSLAPFKRGETVTECRAGVDWFEVDCDGSIKACHDGPPSRLNALDEPDYETLKSELAKTLPEGCRCIYDFYFNARLLRKHPVRYLYHVWRTRKLLSGRRP